MKKSPHRVTLPQLCRHGAAALWFLAACPLAVSFAQEATQEDPPELAADAAKPNERLPLVDLSADTGRHVIVASGAGEKGKKINQGHPTTVLLPDGKTMFCVWTRGHGGPVEFMKRSDDGGLTWSELLKLPESWPTMRNCPAIYRLVDPKGVARLFVFAKEKESNTITQAHSEDEGKTWTGMKSTGLVSIMPFCTIVPIEGGKRLLAMTNISRAGAEKKEKTQVIAQSLSSDGGLTWSPWRLIVDLPDRKPCEPCIVRSPDGKQMLCLMREYGRTRSVYMTSDDEGKTWSGLKPLPRGLGGDRHVAKYAPDGRLVVGFRERTLPGYAAWVGTYDDIIAGRPGQYRIKLIHSYKGWDCGYSGLELLPDGTFVGTTYIKYGPGPEFPSIVSARFKLEEMDSLARKAGSAKSAATNSQTASLQP
jgi:hypothetical protein